VSAVPAASPNPAFSTHLPVEVNKPKQLSPFNKMFCLLVREKKVRCAGTVSKSELRELLGVCPIIWRSVKVKRYKLPTNLLTECELRR